MRCECEREVWRRARSESWGHNRFWLLLARGVHRRWGEHLREERKGEHAGENAVKRGAPGGSRTHLSTLLLGQHLLLLLHDLRLVLEHEREREADEERGGGDDPDEVANDLACCLYCARGPAELGGYALAGGRGNDVGKGDDALVEGLLAIELRANG